jgi:hypothetical protein
VQASVWLVFTVAHASLRLLGDSHCPAAADVEAQLRLVDPDMLDSTTEHLVVLDRQNDNLRVRLFDADGQEREARSLAGPKTCEEWAQITAALLASWDAKVASPDLPLSGPPPPPPPEPRHPALPPAPVAGAATGATVASTASNPDSAAAEKKGPRFQGEIGVGLLGAVAGNGTLAIGGQLLAGLAPTNHPYGALLTVVGTSSRSLALGDGTARWQRFSMGLGGYGTLGRKRLKLDLGAEFLAGLLSVKGTDFSTSRSSLIFDPGVGLFARFKWTFSRHGLAWLNLGAALFPVAQEVQVLAGTTPVFSARIPPLDFSATLGLSFAGGL